MGTRAQMTDGDLALVGALLIGKSQASRQAVKVTVGVRSNLSRTNGNFEKQYFINSRPGGFDIYPYDPAWEENWNHRNHQLLKTAKSPQAVVNFVTGYGKSAITLVDLGSPGTEYDDPEWFTAHSLITRRTNLAPAGAVRIQAAWRGFQGRRQAARTKIHRELALVPPRHGFPGGGNYRAIAARYAAPPSSVGKKRKQPK